MDTIVAIDRRFGGTLVRSASLEFAVSLQKQPRLNAFTKWAHLWRAIVLDHPFSDGNKRTAVAATLLLTREHYKEVDTDALIRLALDIARSKTTGIRAIARRLKHALKEN